MHLEQRIEKSLEQETEEFKLLIERINPQTNLDSGYNITSIFDIFIERNVPDDNEFLLTLWNGKIYKSSPKVLPAELKQDSDLVKYLAQLTKPETNQVITREDTIVYRAD